MEENELLQKETVSSYTVPLGATMNIDYNLLKTFTKVAELGSFTKAAKYLNQPKSRVSRAIARLEDELGVQLIRRTTRKTSLTSIGQDFHQGIRPLLAGLDDQLTRISDSQDEMSGVIRISAPEDIAQTLVADTISNFSARFPNVEIQTIVTNEFLDLTKENIDLCFRGGKLSDSSLIQKKIMDVNFIVVCSKVYQENYGQVLKASDLVNHKFLSFRRMEKDYFKEGSTADEITISPIITADSISMLLTMVLNNAGVAILPDYFCKPHLSNGTLIRLLPSLKTKNHGIHILYAQSKNKSLKLKRFIESIGQL